MSTVAHEAYAESPQRNGVQTHAEERARVPTRLYRYVDVPTRDTVPHWSHRHGRRDHHEGDKDTVSWHGISVPNMEILLFFARVRRHALRCEIATHFGLQYHLRSAHRFRRDLA